MRIVGGEFGGRRFNPPAKIPARPTTEMAREGLFNTLNAMTDLEGVKTLELFGGTGSITYELASHGAADMTIEERDATSVDFIKKTVQALEIADKVKVVKADAFRFLKQCTDRYDLIFADPPYALENMDEIPDLVLSQNLLSPGGLLILEHSPRNNYQTTGGFLRVKNYGTTTFSFFTLTTK